MRIVLFFFLLLILVGCHGPDQRSNVAIITADTYCISKESDWVQNGACDQSLSIMQEGIVGEPFDLMGDGALILSKKDSNQSFYKTTTFNTSGRWISNWMHFNDRRIKRITVDAIAYGKLQDLREGWTKFIGNPLVCEHGWHNASKKSLQLPESYSGQPNDQTLTKGSGPFKNKWVLFFNIGPWAVKGWGMAVADSLAPLKKGVNPFRIDEKYFPLNEGTEGDKDGEHFVGYNAPNDWLYVNGTWYAPDESRDHQSRMWTSTDMKTWTNQGPVDGINGHDPGMAYDGENFYLFNEADNNITYCVAKNPLGKWDSMGVALEVGDHTGDADLIFINNRWYMFFDDHPHSHYKLGYASTSAEDFPLGWEKDKHDDFFGPHKPEQNMVWDDDTEEGNQFGTGDASVALEGTTLYLTHERPIGIAYKELDVALTNQHKIKLKIEIDNNNDTLVDKVLVFDNINDINLKNLPKEKNYRFVLELSSKDPTTSPLIRSLKIELD